ncbi:hypothetical protein [Nocardia arthritidis]|uniref:Uncharacterized protein n=1 Tax=Nocardia arthritidis TaxID=228602 RepID=A0A6G9YHY9_9NOCA|nr:hypothetical protein [Nocardia arthritidis]QIS12677.1 hypothetical protein F5544_24100 [Nocardia arthritidis]
MAIVAAGVIVAGLLHKPEPELTTKPTEPGIPPGAATGQMYVMVTPPVTYPVAIPGCDKVEPPYTTDTGGFSVAIGTGSYSYDSPAYPWFTGAKAAAMTQALRNALPSGVEIALAPIEKSLVFQPIPVMKGEPDKLPDGTTDADATVVRGDLSGSLRVTVRQSTHPIPPCRAGSLDERRHLADGVIADTHDSWLEAGHGRTSTRSVDAYLPDGTVVTAEADNSLPDQKSHSAGVPLTIDELVAMTTSTPQLRATTPAPPGTPEPPQRCTASGSGKSIDRNTATRLNGVLARIPLDGLTLDRPLGDLHPGDFDFPGLNDTDSVDGVCQTVRVTAGQERSNLSIAIGTRPSDPEAFEGAYETARQLPDGVSVQHHEYEVSDDEPNSTRKSGRTVTVTYASGSWVRIDSTGTPPLTYDQLEAIALTPGLEVS